MTKGIWGVQHKWAPYGEKVLQSCPYSEHAYHSLMTLTTHTCIHSILTWLFSSEVVLKWYKLCTSPDKLSLVTSKTEYNISYIWFIKIISCAIVKILLYTMHGEKLKTSVSSASLLLLFKKGLRSKTKPKTTFIGISAVQFEAFFKHVRLWLISILMDDLGSDWTWV